jgi:type IV pilus assembly protein PilC
MQEQAHTASGKYIVYELAEGVARGASLSSRLETFSGIFGEFAVNIVRVGEVSGTLHENLLYLAEELKKGEALKRKILGALIYPALIVAATIVIASLLTLYIFPKIVPVFESFKTELPLSTTILIAVSTFLLQWGWWLLGGIVLFSVGVVFLLRVRAVKLVTHRLILAVPLLGTLARYYNLANISRTLSLLLKTDVRVVQALEIVAASTQNLAYRQELERAGESIIGGKKMSAHFAQDRTLFPSMLPAMVYVGESTGNLSESLRFCAEMYEEEIDDLTKNLTSLIEPALMIFMGIIVGFVAISIITPIYGITQHLNPYR